MMRAVTGKSFGHIAELRRKPLVCRMSRRGTGIAAFHA
jgi:hypothetical protein